MPRPLPPGASTRRRVVPLRLSEPEEAPVRAVADAEHGGDLSAAIRTLLAEALAGRAAKTISRITKPDSITPGQE